MFSGRLHTCAILAGALLAVCGCAAGGRQSGSAPVAHMAPHPIPDSGTFFEGWYLRLTAPGALSLGALAAAWHDSALDRSESYLALLVQQPEALRLEVHDAVVTTRPAIRHGGAPDGTSPAPASPSTFRWELTEGTAVTEHSMTIALPDGSRFAATLGSPVFWNPADPSQGPEGVWLNSSRLKSHWFVHSTASTVQWSLTSAGGRTQSGSGLAHFEKNWGASFPSRWVWAQGIDPLTGTSFVLAGGDNPIVPLMPGGAWMLGVRSPLGAWDYATARGGQELGVWHDGCRGTITLRADSPEGLVEITVAASRESFGSIKAPRAGGFLPLSEMSFRGDAVLRITPRRHGEAGEATTFTIPASALEFGGSWRCATDKESPR
jgi:hypothetical protein